MYNDQINDLETQGSFLMHENSCLERLLQAANTVVAKLMD
jgi:hypothetical protein